MNRIPCTRPAASFEKLHQAIGETLDTTAADLSPETLLDVFKALADKHDTDVNSPFNMGYYCIDADVASLAALDETERRAANIAVEGQHPAALAFELHSVERVLSAFGIDPATGHGHYTSGGTEANLTAMIVALGDRISHRNRKLPKSAYDPGLCLDADGKPQPFEYVHHGVVPLKVRPTVYVTAQTHASIDKNARTLVGIASIRDVPMDKDLRMNPRALERMIVADRKSGRFAPFLVVGTVGATGSGIVDPLRRIADVCARQGVWLHVDAPWGGIAAFSPALKKTCLDGIELADSITFDPHKTLVPLGAGGSGMFLTRHRDAVARSFNVSGQPVATHDYAYMSLQGSRANNGLRVLSQLVEPRRLAARVEREARLGDLLRRKLRASGWTIASKTPLPVVTAVHPKMAAGDISAATIVRRLAKAGILAKAETLRPGETPALRLGIISRRTSEADIAAVVDDLDSIVG
ncbi:pyridoxal phosphate-dependent decarboxylase family protein [Bauldia litoralis]|uniref:Pyridoxal-dependent decarboxylase conserved domain-containing protein n=1 Tax=Bauldia litoralis TaxID=665467 RepID=A0A1G6A6J5_9HYPH|nr:pyridoxal-dependent decarboxylase [Bauldia litoralis]SDB04022.1 Pyridoxal-dependent decarboxylase conserved domain-containing protein [Bauldia litoralis]